MTDSESEDATLARIEAALLKIASLARQPKPAGGEINRAALLNALDLMINRPRSGLDVAKSNHTTE